MTEITDSSNTRHDNDNSEQGRAMTTNMHYRAQNKVEYALSELRAAASAPDYMYEVSHQKSAERVGEAIYQAIEAGATIEQINEILGD